MCQTKLKFHNVEIWLTNSSLIEIFLFDPHRVTYQPGLLIHLNEMSKCISHCLLNFLFNHFTPCKVGWVGSLLIISLHKFTMGDMEVELSRILDTGKHNHPGREHGFFFYRNRIWSGWRRFCILLSSLQTKEIEKVMVILSVSLYINVKCQHSLPEQPVLL